MRTVNDIKDFIRQLQANIDFLRDSNYFPPKAAQIEMSYDWDLIEDLIRILDGEEPLRDDIYHWYYETDEHNLEVYRNSIGLVDI